MKSLLFILALMITTISHAQWLLGEYVDDFGDKTGEVYLYQTSAGTFSNSATTNSKCSYFLEIDEVDSIMGITIYPYAGRTEESWLESTFQVIKIKKPTGEVVSVDCFCGKSGTIYFANDSFNRIMEVIKGKGEYKASLKHKTEYSESDYRFIFNN